MSEIPGPTPNNIERGVLKKRSGTALATRVFGNKPYIEPENPAKSREVRDLPSLIPNDHRIRFNPQGDVYIVSYRKKPQETTPRSRWGKYKDIEAAIRGAGYVREAYGMGSGEEIGKVRKVIDLVKGLSSDLQKRGVTPLDMGLMAQDAAAALVKSGFDTAVKFEKRQILEKIMSATNLDRQNRVNPSRSRLILSHAWIDLIQELLVGQRIEDKYGSVRAKLIRSREFQRFLLSQAASYIEDAATLRRGDHEEGRTIRELKAFAQRYLSNQFINTKPYSQVAAVSRYLIMTTGTPLEKQNLAKYIGEDAVIYDVLPMSRLTPELRKRRLAGIKGRIERVLEDGEVALVPKDSK